MDAFMETARHPIVKWQTLDSQTKRAWQLFPILCFAWLFYALDGSVIQVLMTNSNFQKVCSFEPFP